jgi:hypothetical protein
MEKESAFQREEGRGDSEAARGGGRSRSCRESTVSARRRCTVAVLSDDLNSHWPWQPSHRISVQRVRP